MSPVQMKSKNHSPKRLVLSFIEEENTIVGDSTLNGSGDITVIQAEGTPTNEKRMGEKLRRLTMVVNSPKRITSQELNSSIGQKIPRPSPKKSDDSLNETGRRRGRKAQQSTTINATPESTILVDSAQDSLAGQKSKRSPSQTGRQRGKKPDNLATINATTDNTLLADTSKNVSISKRSLRPRNLSITYKY